MLSRHHQVALLDPALTRVLTVPTADGPRLVRLEPRWPDHRELVAAVGDPGAFLAGPPWREDNGTVTNVLVGTGSSSLPNHAWQPLDELAPLGLSEESVAGLRRTVRERLEGAPDDGRAAWFLPGWRDLVLAWVDEVLPNLGYARAGDPEAVKVWTLSAVLRFPVTQGGKLDDLWFKATCDGFHREPALTLAVAELARDVMPRVLAVEADRAWMLMEPIPHAHVDTPAEQAPEVARALARLQLDTLDRRDDLARAGVVDRGLEPTLAWLRTVVHESVERRLMTEEQRRAAAQIEPWLAECCRVLWSSGLPDTLAHGDLGLGNVAWADGRPVFYDWTDACFTHPFLDAHHLADSAHRTGGEEARAAVWEAYAEVWRAAYPQVDLDAAWARVREVERVFQMITFEQIYRAQPEGSRWELATIVVEILDKLVEARRGATARSSSHRDARQVH